MRDREIKDLQDRVRALEAATAKIRRGVVTATSPLTVTIGGSAPYANVWRLYSYSPTINDDVMILTWEHDMIVLGKKVSP